MSPFLILSANSASDRGIWLDLWSVWPDREIFAHPDYVQLYANPQARAMAAVWRSHELNIIYPFLLRDLSVEPFWAAGDLRAFDITSAYGYSGPFAWGPGDRQAVGRQFWAEFQDWAAAHDVASEFVRFSLFDDMLLPYPGQRWNAGDHIIRPLDANESDMWIEFDHKVRKNVNKALRSGVRIETDETGDRVSEFLDIYRHTMDRRRALNFYYFPRELFDQLHRSLQGAFIYFYAVVDGATVSAELVLVSERSVYSFLGGTREEWFSCRPNDLLKLSVIKWAQGRRKRNFVLGGGYQAGDGIYRYKLAFAPNGRTPYYLGGRVLSEELNAELIRAREQFATSHAEAWSPRPAFFPAYRS